MYLQVYNPFQQANTNLQGGSVQLQGGYNPQTPAPVAGPSLAELKAPTPAPIASQASKTPSSVPITIRGPQVPVQPQITDLSGSYGLYNGTVYDKATGQGLDLTTFKQKTGIQNPNWNALKFDTSYNPTQQTQQSGGFGLGDWGMADSKIPPQTPDPYLQLAAQAGAAGVSADDLSKLIGLTSEEKNQIYKNLGIDTLASEVFSTPSKSTQQIYTEAYNAAGLADIKTKFQELQDKINSRYADLNTATEQINNHPWISEASRVGRIRRLMEAAQSDIANLETQAQQYADLYNEGLAQVNQTVQNTVADISYNQQLKAQQLQYLIAKAEQDIAAAQQSKLARYFPEYLTGVNSITKYETLNQGQTLIDPKTGKVIYSVPKTYAPSGSGSGSRITTGDNPQLYSGLSSSTATAVRSKVSAFKSEPVIQNFATIQEGYNFVQSLSNTTINPADDQALIYSLAKALDPGSVVREGEYATAQKYAQSWVKAFGKGIEQALLGTGFLSETARQNIKKTIQQKYAASKQSYDNLYKQYVKSINSLTGRSDGDSFLTDYSITPSVGSAGVPSSSVQDAINKWVP